MNVPKKRNTGKGPGRGGESIEHPLKLQPHQPIDIVDSNQPHILGLERRPNGSGTLRCSRGAAPVPIAFARRSGAGPSNAARRENVFRSGDAIPRPPHLLTTGKLIPQS